MSEDAQALLLNAIPLLAASILYVAAAAAQHLRRPRGAPGWPALLPGAPALAFAVLGVVVFVEREPLAGNAWLSLAAIALASLPALALLAGRPRPAGRPAQGEPAVDPRTQQGVAVEARGVSPFTGALARVDDPERLARLLVDEALAVLGVEFAGLAVLEDGRACGVLAVLDGQELSWWRDVELDLAEPSAIASAAFEAAPFAVYDIASSPHVNQEIATDVGAKSGVWIPIVSGERVIAVLAVAATTARRAFSAEEISLVQELGAEAGLALERARSRAALAEALRRERLVARISHALRSAVEPGAVVSVAAEETARAVGADRCLVRLGAPGEERIAGEWKRDALERVGDRAARLPDANLAARERRTVAIADAETAPELDGPAPAGRDVLTELGTRAALATPVALPDEPAAVLAVYRSAPGAWSGDEIALVEAVAQEIALALQISHLLAANRRSLGQQAALLEAAQALTRELDFDVVLERLVEQVVQLLGADAADCWILDSERRVLRRRAAHGFPEGELGREAAADGPVGEAITLSRPLRRLQLEGGAPGALPGYTGFAEVMHTPIASGGELRGVLGVSSRELGRFRDDDLDVLGAFGGFASLALRNVEAFEESARQARVQRGFFRIAEVLGEPLSLAGTLEAVAHAASETLGGAFAAVLMPSPGGLELVAPQDLPASLERALAGGVAADERLLSLAAGERRIVASADVGGDERFSEAWRGAAREAGCRALLAIPVERERAGQHGLVLVFFEESRRFADDDLELAEHLARAAQGSLERSALYEQERTARSLAQQLARTGSLLATELDPAAVLDEVVREAPRLVGVDACAIRVLEDDELVISAVEGADADAAVGVRSPATAWLSGDVVQSRAPLAIADAAADERLLEVDPLLRLGYRGFLGVPLSGPGDSLHGVLAVYSRAAKSWRGEEVEALLALAANASAALSNAELYQRVALEKEQNFAILANIADGIVALDRNGHVVLWNSAAEQITGVPASEALGRTPFDVLGRRLESDGDAPAGNRLVSILRGREEVWLSLSEAIMRDPAGVVAGRIFAFRDISSDRLVEEMKSGFVSTVSQELRRPLTSIYGFAETLLRRDVLFGEEERRTFLGYIASESERLTTIVDQLLNVARLDTGDLQVNVTPTDVGAAVAAVVAAVEAAAQGEANGHRFVVDLPEEPIAAAADPDKLRQVLANLVDNAIKFSPEGGTVTVAARKRGDNVEVSVADEGIGIPRAEQGRIFRKFYRADAAAGPDGAGGTGLGLFIAEGLVSAMGGRIWVSSAEGEGSSFTFELPVAKVSEPVR